MKLERTVFILTLVLCIGAVIAAYRYRALVINPQISVAASQSIQKAQEGIDKQTEVQLGVVNAVQSGTTTELAPASEEAAASTEPMSAGSLQVDDSDAEGGMNNEEMANQSAATAGVSEIQPETSTTSQNNAGSTESGEAVSEEADVGPAELEKADSGTIDTGDADTGDADTGDADTGDADTGAADERVIFDDALIGEWQNWGWDTTTDFGNTEPVAQGDASIAIKFDNGWGALWLSTFEPIDREAYDVLRFWIHGGTQGGQPTRVSLADGNQMLLDMGVEIVAEANVWRQIDIPLDELDADDEISGIVWQDALGNSQPTFYIDQVSVAKLESTTAEQSDVQSSLVREEPYSEITIEIDVDATGPTISPNIYGINYGDEPLLEVLGHTVRRWGGNATTRYNWQIDVANRASDWFFENIPEEIDDVASLPRGSSADRYIIQNQMHGAETIMTVPMIGWSPKSREVSCGFSVSKYGQQQAVDQWNADCGNGYTPNGEPITGDPMDTSTPIDSSFVAAWIDHLVESFGTAANGGVAYYNLDNEPMLWHHTHRDVHPTPVTYDELYERTVEYATAIKKSDPSAMTLGPSVWGWMAYFYSAFDQESSNRFFNRNPDRNAHDDLPLLAWYLQQMRKYEEENGTRILDYLDVHYYPQAENVALSPKGGKDTRELRLRSTRALWDESYVDESWINEPVRLIPRLREWIDAYYPGTKLALTEYNWGALDDINGALAQAEVLGIFGREGVDLATLWAPTEADDPFTFAFQIYRNYDGNGAQYGDINVNANSSDLERLSVYSSQRTTDDALTILVINKSDNAQTAALTVNNFALGDKIQRFQYSESDEGAILALPDIAPTGTQWADVVPAQSLTLFVIPKAS